MTRARAMLLPLVLLGMQACWLGAWLAVVESRVPGSHAITPAVLGFLPAGMVAFPLLRQLPVRRLTAEVLYWALWCLLAAVVARLLLSPETPWTDPAWLVALPRAAIRFIFETHPAEMLVLVGTGVAWHLGRRPMAGTPDYGRLLGDFQFGLVLLLTAFLVSRAVNAGSDGQVLLALAFFALSLTGVALSRGEEGGNAATLIARKHFSSSLLSFVAIVSLAGLLASVAVTPEVISAVVDAVRYVLHLVERGMAFVASLIPAPDVEPAEPAAPATGDDSSLLEFYRSLPVSVLLKRVLYLLYVAMIVGMLLFGLWRLCGQILAWLRRRSMSAGIEMESLDTGFLSDLLALMRWIETRIQHLFRRLAELAGRSGGAAAPTVASLYADLLRWAGRKLHAREPSQSPYEYQTELQQLLPTAADDLALVTETYVCMRYGRYEPESADIEAMARASHRIRHATRLKGPDTSTKEGETS
ncbi:MAG: DUF4129 domain-containing protein [Dehalococcoidia bacterium]|nr:DUF4129 domain-containing protein [Dehalococcoidia bacterium]